MDQNSCRLNAPDTSTIILDVFGHQLHLSQDPNSQHLGTTVWDASMVFVKFLEKNSRKGRFSSSRLKGKRVIELGAGCGLAGIGMALLGCDVISTDQAEVLPLLARNIERNMSRIMQESSDPASIGSIKTAVLDWGNDEQIRDAGPPFDFIIGTDVVYSEHLLDPLLHTIFALSGPRTTVMVGYEIRSTSVHGLMLEKWKKSFELKTIPRSKMDPKYQHPSIQLYVMELKSQSRPEEIVNHVHELAEALTRSNEVPECNGTPKAAEIERDGAENEAPSSMENINLVLDEWNARRLGSMAARLLRDVKIT